MTLRVETKRHESRRTEHRRHPGVPASERPTIHRQAAPSRAHEKMKTLPRVLIGFGLLLFTMILLAHLVWAWSIATRLVVESPDTTPAAIRVHWLGNSFTPTLTFTVLLIVALTAMAGSTAATALVFSNRAGHDQLERFWVWWYVLRPGVAATVAVVAYVTLKAGLLGQIDETGMKGLALAAAIGGLTGLFTDKMLEKLRAVLGLSEFSQTATRDAGPAAETDADEKPEPAPERSGVERAIGNLRQRDASPHS